MTFKYLTRHKYLLWGIVVIGIAARIARLLITPYVEEDVICYIHQARQIFSGEETVSGWIDNDCLLTTGKWSVNEAFTGRHSLKIENHRNGNSEWTQMFPTDVAPGTRTINVSVMAKGECRGIETARLFLEIIDQDNKYHFFAAPFPIGNFPWTRAEKTITLDRDIRKIKPSFRYFQGDGVVYMDDLRITSPSAPDRNLAVNGDFEKRRGTFETSGTQEILPFWSYLLASGEILGIGAYNLALLLGIALSLPMILAVYGSGMLLFKKHYLALLAAMLAAFHPYFVRMSVSCLREALYLPLFTVCIWLGLMAIKHKSFKLWFVYGFLAGVAAITRREGIELLAIPLLSLPLIEIAEKSFFRRWKIMVLDMIIICGSFLIPFCSFDYISLTLGSRVKLSSINFMSHYINSFLDADSNDAIKEKKIDD